MRQRLAAYALITDAADRVLLARHLDRHGRRGKWLLPGGGVKPGEHPEQAVVREVREETGLTVTVGPPVAVLSDVGPVGRRNRMLHTVRLIYRARLAESAVPLLSDTARWCAPADWQALPLVPFTVSLLTLGVSPGTG
jgi:8-oxo-dGTP diphosphatase